MTIILQHQFWDLVVTEDRFEVGLSFGGIPSGWWSRSPRSRVSSIRRCNSACSSSRPMPRPKRRRQTLPACSARSSRCRRRRRLPREADEPAKPSEGAEVVRLDRFRKK